MPIQPLVEQARELKSQGLSNPQISARIGIPRQTLARWVEDVIVPGAPVAKVTKSRIERWARYRVEAETEWLRLRNNSSFIFGLGIYAGEGSKCDNNTAGAANANHLILAKVVEFFQVIGVPKDRIKAGVHVHDEAQVAVAENFWSVALGIPRSQFERTGVFISENSKRTARKKNNLPHGTCYLKVHDTAVRQKIGRWLELALEPAGQARSLTSE